MQNNTLFRKRLISIFVMIILSFSINYSFTSFADKQSINGIDDITNIQLNMGIDYSNLDFNYTSHPNRYIISPHTSFPTLIRVDDTLKIVLQNTENLSAISFSLNNRNQDISYNLNCNSTCKLPEDIKEGLYDLVMFNNNKIVDIQTHAVKIFEQYPKPVRFVHLTDTHLPSFSGEIDSLPIVSEVLQNMSQDRPDFILLTGDFIEGILTYKINQSSGESLYSYNTLLENGLKFIDQFNIPIFIIPGNHDIMNIYPSRESSKDIWYSYMYPKFVQRFDLGPVSFVGYGSEITGISNTELEEIGNALINSPRPFKLLYTHYDYDLKIVNNQEQFGINTVLYGHDHLSIIEWKNKTLWVETHNAYEPEKSEPIKGYRLIEIKQSNKLVIDGLGYSFNLPEYTYPGSYTPSKNNIPNDTVTSSFSDITSSLVTEKSLTISITSFFILFILIQIVRKQIK